MCLNFSNELSIDSRATPEGDIKSKIESLFKKFQRCDVYLRSTSSCYNKCLSFIYFKVKIIFRLFSCQWQSVKVFNQLWNALIAKVYIQNFCKIFIFKTYWLSRVFSSHLLAVFSFAFSQRLRIVFCKSFKMSSKHKICESWPSQAKKLNFQNFCILP